MRIPVTDLLPDNLQTQRKSLEIQQDEQRQTLDFLFELPSNDKTPVNAPRGHASITIYRRDFEEALSYHVALAVSSGPPTRIGNIYQISETPASPTHSTESFNMNVFQLQHVPAHTFTSRPRFVGALLLSPLTQSVSLDDVDVMLRRIGAEPEKGDWGEARWSCTKFVIKLIRELGECGMLEKEVGADDGEKFYRRLQARAQMLANGLGDCFVCGDVRVLDW